MKKIILGLLSFLLVIPVLGQTYTIGNLTYNVTNNTKNEVEVTGSATNLVIVDIPATITTTGDVTYTVTSIGKHAFKDNNIITSVIIPATVTSIGQQAFQGCTNLKDIVCLSSTPPSISSQGAGGFSGVSGVTLHIPLEYKDNYTSWSMGQNGFPTVSTTDLRVQQTDGVVELENSLTLSGNTTLTNNGVIRITYGAELINKTNNNIGGIVEVETPNLSTNQWHFLGAPFNGYKLEAIKKGTKDVSVSMFDYSTGAWSEEWATIEDTVGAGEGFFLWSFAGEPTVFTTYGDGELEYDVTQTPAYSLNNDDVEVRKTLRTNQGNWMALANPYPFKLSVTEFLKDQTGVQGNCVYTLNASGAFVSTAEVLNVIEGFFVNFENSGSQVATFNKEQRYLSQTSGKKSLSKQDFIRLKMNDGDYESEVLFAHNEEAKQNYDRFDANKMFALTQITEPYFVTDGNALVKEEVNSLPYTATLNVKSFSSKEVTFRLEDIPEDIVVFLLDNGQDIKMNGGVEYTTTVSEGENENRFQLLVKNVRKFTEIGDLEVSIISNNREVSVNTDSKDLTIKVYDALGREVFATKDYKFTLNDVPAGAYMIKAYNKKVTKTGKIIIE